MACGKRKFQKGGPFRTLDELNDWLLDWRWVYWHNVPKHPAIIRNMSFSSVYRAMMLSTLCRAELTEFGIQQEAEKRIDIVAVFQSAEEP
jgi:hypothetical protein